MAPKMAPTAPPRRVELSLLEDFLVRAATSAITKTLNAPLEACKTYTVAEPELGRLGLALEPLTPRSIFRDNLLNCAQWYPPVFFNLLCKPVLLRVARRTVGHDTWLAVNGALAPVVRTSTRTL